MNDEKATSPRKSRIVPFFLGLSFLVLTSGVVWYFVMVKPTQLAASGAIDRVENFLGSLLGGKGTIVRNDSSSVVKVEDVGELALMEFQMKISKDMQHEQVALGLLTSTKRLRMEGKFRVKVGYDISKGLAVDYDEDGKAVITGLGGPQVLSAEMISMETVEDQSGVWNKVEESDRDALTNQLRLQAIRDVKESGMLEQLDSLMRQNMRSMLGVTDLVIDARTLVIP